MEQTTETQSTEAETTETSQVDNTQMESNQVETPQMESNQVETPQMETSQSAEVLEEGGEIESKPKIINFMWYTSWKHIY